MALKADRHELQTDISFFMNEVASRGGVAVFSTAGSGAAMDDSAATVAIPGAADLAKHPAGLLLNDVVDLDLTRQHINFAKDEMQKGGKVLLLRRGFVVTDQISGSITLGELAYFHVNGALTSATAYSGSTAVGRWLSKKDADGFAKVDINIV